MMATAEAAATGARRVRAASGGKVRITGLAALSRTSA